MNLPEKADFVIIGSGPAGQKAAIQAAKAGKSVVLVEREQSLGGACVERGTIPSKTLREHALQLARVKDNAYAFSTEIKKDISMSVLLGRMKAVLKGHNAYIEDQMERNEIYVAHGMARFLDSDRIEILGVDGSKKQIKAKHVVIAAGSRPRNPAQYNVDHENILDSDSILSMAYLPRSITIVGSGVIACEYASIFAILGVKVVMIDEYPSPLGFLDPELSSAFVEFLREYDCVFAGNENIEDIGWDGVSQVTATLESGQIVHADKALIAAGREANLSGMNIENSGLNVNDHGLIDVNTHCQTPVKHIYAAGDVIGPPALASTSMEQGRRAVCHALSLSTNVNQDTVPMGIYTIPEISSIGLDEKRARASHESVFVGHADFSEIARGHISGIQSGFLKLVSDGQFVLGAQIVGEGATELIHLAQSAMLTNSELAFFVDNIFNFPTMAEAYRVAALDIIGQTQLEAAAPVNASRASM